ncbi:glycoside hydrolase family 73 protein [Streptococcus iniae]|uniref:N-acetylmuramidase n=1 Tax=Streptococcus iniae TaxID=1346 RepID=A0A3L8GK14_STRIN|nr:glycoside hydrolase family 73 protein [Streptococcus iniae]AGM98945.1 mannosyl-glycoprotein endo-beta-N-acetylglucosaminidase family protein [Streptococcus iniae SF1]AHY15898.1 N-acetylmuramidase [Streptococcus iniae]AHY17765.1 N-acetylmuramidase [Streptococcus iniae]APD31936.1 N-acetylmuramidase [Streptococcus iniae]ASL34881.1 mannosyl-glycoprotein endo-beta-N-acetylglucosaminidase family protein [Streptococcus iniae]
MGRKKRKRSYQLKKTSSKGFKLTVLSFVLLTLLVSVWSLKKARQDLKPLAETASLSFIRKSAHSAADIARKNDLYTSVMLAQATLESQNGQSQLSQKPYYNFFGVKGDYKGKSAVLPTLEDDGQGNLYTVDAKFRSYGKMINSFKDYATVLSDPLYENTHKAKTKHYQEATATLTGRYATDTSYHVKLNNLIETYRLYYFDYPF